MRAVGASLRRARVQSVKARNSVSPRANASATSKSRANPSTNPFAARKK